MLRLGLVPVVVLALLAPSARAAAPLTGKVTISGSQTGYVLVEVPQRTEMLDASVTERGAFAAAAITPHAGPRDWHNTVATAHSDGTPYNGYASTLKPGTHRLYLLTPPGVRASASFTFAGLGGESSHVPDRLVPLHRRVRTGRPSAFSPLSLTVGGHEAPASGSVGFHGVHFASDAVGHGEVCEYKRTGSSPYVPEAFDFEPGCAANRATVWSSDMRTTGAVGGAQELYLPWFQPDTDYVSHVGGNLTAPLGAQLTMTSTWIDFADPGAASESRRKRSRRRR